MVIILSPCYILIRLGIKINPKQVDNMEQKIIVISDDDIRIRAAKLNNNKTNYLPELITALGMISLNPVDTPAGLSAREEAMRIVIKIESETAESSDPAPIEYGCKWLKDTENLLGDGENMINVTANISEQLGGIKESVSDASEIIETAKTDLLDTVENLIEVGSVLNIQAHKKLEEDEKSLRVLADVVSSRFYKIVSHVANGADKSDEADPVYLRCSGIPSIIEAAIQGIKAVIHNSDSSEDGVLSIDTDFYDSIMSKAYASVGVAIIALESAESLYGLQDTTQEDGIKSILANITKEEDKIDERLYKLSERAKNAKNKAIERIDVLEKRAGASAADISVGIRVKINNMMAEVEVMMGESKAAIVKIGRIITETTSDFSIVDESDKKIGVILEEIGNLVTKVDASILAVEKIYEKPLA